MIRFSCSPDVLPVVTTQLAQEGFTIVNPNNSGAVKLAIRLNGEAAILITNPPNDGAVVDVYGEGQFSVAQMLEALPIDLHRQN
jgi:hypothetical protein